MKMDRALQRRILERLRDEYPSVVEMWHFEEAALDHFQFTLCYLNEHELIDGEVIQALGQKPEIQAARITARGLDFLEDDGGLDAILRTVTVKFDPDDLRTMLAAKISAANVDDERKSSLLHTIRALPADALRHLTLKLLEAAMDQLPGVLPIIQKFANPG